ncbi:MAG: hypothetical protein MK132_09855 [Lentisphaerales bacterium]|nr:hypothetical protein [Lentisphaerales bacterium]
MKFFKELSFFVLIVLSVAVNAQDYGPVKVDLDGYINDRAGEFHKSTVVEQKGEEKKVVEAVKPKEKVDPVEARKARRRIVAPTDSPVRKTTIPLNSNLTFGGAKSTESNLYLYIGVGVAALVIIIVAFVVLAKAGKKKRMAQQNQMLDDTVSLADKIDANEQALMAETNFESALVQTPPVSAPEPTMSEGAQEMADKFARETKVDERGRNPSGLIIDEDKYFQSGVSNFVDEDFDG